MKIKDQTEIVNTWAGIIEEATGISLNENKSKVEWMSIYSHYHRLSENKKLGNTGQINEALWNTTYNTPGMGNVELPGQPGYAKDFSTQSKGSGDKPNTTLPISMQVAAQTIGLDLVPVVPMDGPLTFLTYVDFIYANGKLNQGAYTGYAGDNRPEMIQLALQGAALTAFKTAWSNGTLIPGAHVQIWGNSTTLASPDFEGKLIARSRISGNPIILINKTTSTSTDSIFDEISAGSSITFGIAGTDYVTVTGNPLSGGTGYQGIAGSAEYVRALEDHISGYSGVYFDRILALVETASLADVQEANYFANNPYRRGDGEETPSRSMGFKFYNKSVEAQTWKVDVSVTREQMQDSGHLGYDIKSQANSLLANETTQALNKHILERIFALGATNHEQIYSTSGVHFNVNFDDTTAGTKTFSLGYGINGTLVNMLIPDTEATPAKPATLTGGETLLTAQRRILDQFLAAGNMINIRGRRGPADSAVVNGQIATVLQTISGFQAAPMSNTFNQVNGELYPVGTLAGLTIYTDPNMDWRDTRFVVFRKGDGATPGLVFMPYLIADAVEIVAEGTMAQKIQLMSRYSLVDAGQHPQIYYITGSIKTIAGLLR
jgi:hypothetical protein